MGVRHTLIFVFNVDKQDCTGEGVVSGGSRHVLRHFQKRALQDDPQSRHPVL